MKSIKSSNLSEVSGLSRLDLPAGGTIIVAPERVHRHSGHRFAVWAAAILRIADFPVYLAIPETGRAAREVWGFADAAGFGEMVRIVPPEKMIPDVLKLADVALFLQPLPMPPLGRPADGTVSTRRSIPVAMLAALSEGVPLVVADTPLSRQWFEDGRSALLVKHDEPRQIARALMKLIEDEALARELARAAGELAAGFSETG